MIHTSPVQSYTVRSLAECLVTATPSSCTLFPVLEPIPMVGAEQAGLGVFGFAFGASTGISYGF